MRYETAFALKEQWLTCIDVTTLRIIEWQDRQRDTWLEQKDLGLE
jgi:hypothetical protein